MTAWLARHGLSGLPVFTADVRRRDDVLLLLDALMTQIEARAMFSGEAA